MKMIFGIGTDIVSVERIKQGLERFGERYAQRMLSESEFAGFQASARPAHFLAKRFAAKEACAKAFGTGFRDGLSLRHIAVDSDMIGKPMLTFTGQASTFCRDSGIGTAHLSLADEDRYAIAYVILVAD